MKILTEDAVLICPHPTGKVSIRGTQNLVTVERRTVLVETDPEGRAITMCGNVASPMKPCTNTLKVVKGYSDLIRIDGRRVCLDTVTGQTDGTPPGTVFYIVRSPGQVLVTEVG